MFYFPVLLFCDNFSNFSRILRILPVETLDSVLRDILLDTLLGMAPIHCKHNYIFLLNYKLN